MSQQLPSQSSTIQLKLINVYGPILTLLATEQSESEVFTFSLKYQKWAANTNCQEQRKQASNEKKDKSTMNMD